MMEAHGSLSPFLWDAWDPWTKISGSRFCLALLFLSIFAILRRTSASGGRGEEGPSWYVGAFDGGGWVAVAMALELTETPVKGRRGEDWLTCGFSSLRMRENISDKFREPFVILGWTW